MATHDPQTIARFQQFVEFVLETLESPGSIRARVFRLEHSDPALVGGQLTLLYSPGLRSAAIAAMLPGNPNASAQAAFLDAVRSGAGFAAIETISEIRAALRALSQMLGEHLTEGASSTLILDRQDDGPWFDAAVEASRGSDVSSDNSLLREYLENVGEGEALMDVTFHMLALDVLSGRPEPRGSVPDLVDAYEVWGYRHHPSAVVIIRSFDAGAAIACAAFGPDAVTCDERFTGAVQRLVELRIPGALITPLVGKLSDLELLDTIPAFERIARALALHLERKGLESHLGIGGNPSDLSLGYLETLRLLDPFDEDHDEEGSSPIFEAMAENFLEEPGRLRWTGARERAKSERMEVLVHVAFPAATVLVHFGLPPDPPTVAAYLPPLDDEVSHDRIIDDVRAMIRARSLAGGTPAPLPNNGQFRRLGNDRAVAQLEAILDDIEGGDGMHARLRAGAGPDRARSR